MVTPAAPRVEKRQVNLNLPVTLVEEMDAIAGVTGNNRSEVVRQILQAWVAEARSRGSN